MAFQISATQMFITHKPCWVLHVAGVGGVKGLWGLQPLLAGGCSPTISPRGVRLTSLLFAEIPKKARPLCPIAWPG